MQDSESFIAPYFRTGRRMRNMGEWKACRFLRRLGYRILAHNYCNGRNEIDIIAVSHKEKFYLHMVEVKAHNHPWKHPLSSQTNLRRHKTRNVARAFLIEYVAYLRLSGHKALASELNELDWPLSFDLIWVKRDGPELFSSIF